MNTIPSGPFPLGNALQSPNFSGRVWLHMLVQDNTPFNCPIGHVTFEPGCRNNWHKHPGGQILLVTAGTGYYQQRGKAAQALRPGDVVTIDANVEHWHGASAADFFSHLAISTNPQKGPAQWLEAVSAKDYDAAHKMQPAAPRVGQAPRFSPAALQQYAALFGQAQPALTRTDPELAEIFTNFAFDAVPRHSAALSPETRLLCLLAACIALNAQEEYADVLQAALHTGISPVQLREVVYQAVPYVGMARVRAFVHSTNAALQARGIALPLENKSVTAPGDRLQKGLALQKSIFGAVIDKAYTQAPPSQKHIQEFLSAHCFGDHVSRGGLDVKTRELLTFSMLLSLGGCEPQLKGHIRGNAAVGNDKATLLAALTRLIPYVGYPRALNALNCLNEILPDPQ